MLGKRRKKTDLPAVCAVIVAAGSSRRMGGENKLLLEIDGVPVLARTLSAFQKCAAIRDIVLVCREQDIMPYTELAKAFSIDKLCTVTRGGETRTESVLAGITAAPENAVLVAVHDGARPLVSEAVITEAVTTAAEYGAAAPVVPVKDSIKRIEDGNIAADVARNTLAAVQTPQVFRKDLLRRALTSAAERGYSFTDDCAAVESLGTIVKATHGSYQNIKITTPEDILVAEAVKISMGYQYKPLRITKDIYPCLARKYRSTPTNIEHDIRTMVNVCWEGNKKLLDEIAGYPLEYKPTNSEFIDMLAYYLREIEEEN